MLLSLILAAVLLVSPGSVYDWPRTEATWYGPGFFGNRTACGQVYTRTIIGFAHRTLKCGTRVQFYWRGKYYIAPVIDRGPYGVRGRDIDLSRGLCKKMRRCFTFPIRYRVLG